MNSKLLLLIGKKNINEGEGSRERAEKLTALLEAEKGDNDLLNEIYDKKDFFVKRSQWIIGGDGWGYDIGYGGLDHVLASGEDVNVLTLIQKFTPILAVRLLNPPQQQLIAQFAAAGKTYKEKRYRHDGYEPTVMYMLLKLLWAIDKNQTLKAIVEAENYKGPSLIIAYASMHQSWFTCRYGQEPKRNKTCC